MAQVTSDTYRVAHTYANPVVVSVSPATGRAHTMLHQIESCYSDIARIAKGSDHNLTMFFQLKLVKIALTPLPPSAILTEKTWARDE